MSVCNARVVPKVITLVNRKGGVGKTTSAGYIAMCLHQAGHKVIGLDADPDQSWGKWWNTGALPFAVIEADRQNLLEKAGNYDYVVVDTPPNDPEIIYEVGEVADELIVPLAPSAFDVNRLATTLKAVARVEKMRSKPLSSVLLVKWRENLNISQEVMQMLHGEEVPLLDSRTRDLTRYRSFDTPVYLDEYQAVLKELEVL